MAEEIHVAIDAGGNEERGDINVPGFKKYWFSEWHFMGPHNEYVTRHNFGMTPKIVQIWFCAAEVDEAGNPIRRIEGAHAVTAEGRIDNPPCPATPGSVAALYNCIVYKATDTELHIYTEWTRVGRGPNHKDDWRTVGYYRVLLWA